MLSNIAYGIPEAAALIPTAASAMAKMLYILVSYSDIEDSRHRAIHSCPSTHAKLIDLHLTLYMHDTQLDHATTSANDNKQFPWRSSSAVQDCGVDSTANAARRNLSLAVIWTHSGRCEQASFNAIRLSSNLHQQSPRRAYL